MHVYKTTILRVVLIFYEHSCVIMIWKSRFKMQNIRYERKILLPKPLFHVSIFFFRSDSFGNVALLGLRHKVGEIGIACIFRVVNRVIFLQKMAYIYIILILSRFLESSLVENRLVIDHLLRENRVEKSWCAAWNDYWLILTDLLKLNLTFINIIIFYFS